ncbi:MAG: formate/nitrite transporter family protein [Pyrinomonadaceae bacterium]|nr:formate/nitrite transporter family protein [Pyrinomonadaceae bacterium]
MSEARTQEQKEQQDEGQQDEEQQKEVEQREVEERSAPSGKVVYKAILKEGEEELERSSSALFWSGLAAGLSMGFSLVTEGLLATYLPEAHWRPLIAKFGYSIGFLIVILGRQQLFTENTLTPILPLLKRKDEKTLLNVARLWAIVLVANLLGALLFAWAVARTTAFDPEIQRTFSELGHKAMEPEAATILLRGIFAGWLIALMVWLLPFAETARVWVIIIITYVVGLGNFSHIIAGAVEVFTIAAMNEASWLTVLGRYILPTLVGNIIGGVTLVAALNHAQVVAGGGGEDI